MSSKRSIIVIDNGQEFASQLKLVLEFMSLEVNTLYSHDCIAESMPTFISQARLCFVPYDENLSDISLKIIRKILTTELSMPFVVFGHSDAFEDLSFVVGSVLKMPSFDQLQQFLYAADAHWLRLTKTESLKSFVQEEINSAYSAANLDFKVSSDDSQEHSPFPRTRQTERSLSDKAIKHLNDNLVGDCSAMNHVKDMITRVHDKNASVLITGESGTGKEVVARMLHDLSPRHNKAFVPVNCGAIPAELLESELFGHEKGAFTGAIAARAGRFEIAEGGTLFLDEIGDMPLNMQVKILRVLQERMFERVGATKSKECDVRVIAATHRNLEDMIEKQSFRADLFYRLNVFPIEVPSLRDRVADLGKLVPVLINRLGEQHKAHIELDNDALESLARHNWPGNIRELSNLLERLIIMFPNDTVGINDLPAKYRFSINGQPRINIDSPDVTFEHDPTNLSNIDQQQDNTQVTCDERFALFGTPAVEPVNTSVSLGQEGIDLKVHIAAIEKDLIQQALDESEGVVARAAELLQMRRTTLVEKMRKYEMSR